VHVAVGVAGALLRVGQPQQLALVGPAAGLFGRLHRGGGLARDGRNPTLLIGYGAYGFTFQAFFDPRFGAWLERGGVLAMANVRGSGAFGEPWYRAGFKASKPNTWKDGMAAARWNLLHPTEKPRASHVEQCLAGTKGPVIASTDYVRAFADQIREYVPRRYKVLGTDGFGRSDFRRRLRHHFEVDRHFVAVSALKALADDGVIGRDKVAAALVKYNLDPNKPNPMSV